VSNGRSEEVTISAVFESRPPATITQLATPTKIPESTTPVIAFNCFSSAAGARLPVPVQDQSAIVGGIQAASSGESPAIRKGCSGIGGTADFTTDRQCECGKFWQVIELIPFLGRRPTVGPQTLDLLIGVRIPASQFIDIERVSKGGQCPVFFVFGECGGFCGDREGKTLRSPVQAIESRRFVCN
jgi:hypothetical protein